MFLDLKVYRNTESPETSGPPPTFYIPQDLPRIGCFPVIGGDKTNTGTTWARRLWHLIMNH